ncbi:MAG: NAD-dependent epimerase/dehydratase family protein [Pseudomonadales bacterium]
MSVALVVGAGGFVGRHLLDRLTRRGDDVQPVSSAPGVASWRALRLLEPDVGVIGDALAGVSCIYFVGGAAHESAVAGDEPLLHEVNASAPARWLEAAEAAGVHRFVWLSSIKVLGDVSARPLPVDAPYRPADAYARSKVAGERRLLQSPRGNTAVAVVRPPLVYGSRVRGNFARLLRWADGPVPLPLARATAPRSLVAVENLCDLLLCLGERSDDGVFHVADADDVSVSELLAELRRLLNRPRRQVAVPASWLRAAARAVRREALYQRLFEPLRLDTSATRGALGWSPPRPAGEALMETVTWFRTSR